MDNVPDPPFVEGPDFIERVGQAARLVRSFEENSWNFEAVPALFARDASCDVAAKEIVNVFDGRSQTRFGRLVMKGAGKHFNLLSHESPNATYLGAHPEVFAEVNAQVGSRGLAEFAEFAEMRPLQRVELFNPTVFYEVGQLTFWHALTGVGLFPTGFEDIRRQFAAGNVIRNLMFSNHLHVADNRPSYLEAFAAVRFPTPVMEWMPKPLFGGMSNSTLHIETLLTPEPVRDSHPFLPLVAEGTAELGGASYHLRRFAGSAPKEATRGPKVPPEGA